MLAKHGSLWQGGYGCLTLAATLQVRMRYAPLRILYMVAYASVAARCGIANPVLANLFKNALGLAINGYMDWHARASFLRTWKGEEVATAAVKDASTNIAVETPAAAAASSSSAPTPAVAPQSTVSDERGKPGTSTYVSPLGERFTVSGTQRAGSHQVLMFGCRCSKTPPYIAP